MDLHQDSSHQSMERRDKDHHWFQLFTVRDRVTGEELLNDGPAADISTLPLQTFLPSVDESLQLQEEFRVRIGRVLVEYISYFSEAPCPNPHHSPILRCDEAEVRNSEYTGLVLCFIYIKFCTIRAGTTRCAGSQNKRKMTSLTSCSTSTTMFLYEELNSLPFSLKRPPNEGKSQWGSGCTATGC